MQQKPTQQKPINEFKKKQNIYHKIAKNLKKLKNLPRFIVIKRNKIYYYTYKSLDNLTKATYELLTNVQNNNNKTSIFHLVQY